MFAVYAKEANVDDPLASVVVGERPEPIVQEGWVRVKVTHASLNRHDIFTLRGMTSQEQPIPFPMILGNDAAGVLEDGTPVVLYPVLGSDDWKGDETLDPHWHVISELVPGTMADYVAVPKRNAVPIPDGLSPLHASLLGTAWLTAYRSLFTKSRLIPGQTLLVQGASGGMSTALIQMGRAAGFEVWVTTRNDEGAAIAERLGANRVLRHGEPLPRRVDAVVDNVGAATWADSLKAVKRGGVLVINGITTGNIAETDVLRIFVEQIDIRGTIMGTLEEMKAMMQFVIRNNIAPEVGAVVPMTEARDAIRNMIDGRTQGKTVFTR
ncbi:MULTISPECIES: zinc-binding dehydrogenase [Xanthomonas]|uniref:zinc-binding dehydrogenase n=1 Tax=Xanthomonas TaxID=338 RepID=UPI00080E2276|nr:zinc-binding dehydrogenase [Xanthomonas euvesicatoria]MBV6688713.1 zinc-binding dehydrogenase [Xanthomonas euvesicatoria pv. physalidis]MBV6785289.1 zinc-binding dehydrogenase [Xanthomonas campestris pv. uppalii]MBV6789545.1 zinc-binding dehydrogenase [Xanthomonas campestris pv. clerodendri]MBV6793957.1 zinc-binding dehydrogenase [Xanthomonas campestris pv. daturae]MBV6796663.1 zinc-binding dehydrogenase [Xanthomonas campestris pv. obscurae]